MIDPESITHQTALDVFRRAFMHHVGQGVGKMSCSDLSDKTGIQVRTLKSWRDGQSMPHWGNVLKLGAVFGPVFVSEILSVIGQGGVDYIQPRHSSPLSTVADLMVVTSEITERLRDGVFDNRDKAKTAPLLLNLARIIEEEALAMQSELPQ